LRRRAICIGVSKQQHFGLLPIHQCRNDAEKIGEFLSSPQAGFDASVLIDPNVAQIQHSVFEVAQKCQVDDQLIVYFSGHGRRAKNRRLYLYAANTDVDKLIITGLAFDHLLEILRDSHLRSVLIILDCCYSGAAESSVLIKSADDFLDEAIRESFTEGWLILTSTTSVDVTHVNKELTLSPFTLEFLTACRSLSSSGAGWITIAQVYEEIRFRLLHYRPKLLGENPIFRICRGLAENRQVENAKSEISFRRWEGTYFVFAGLLVLPYFRAWALFNPAGNKLESALSVSKNVDVLYNYEDAFGQRIKRAEEAIRSKIDLLDLLSEQIGARITLLFPIGIEEVTFRRFSGSDRKYIIRKKASIKHQHYPILSERALHCLAIEDDSWTVLETPEDYIKEAFGVELDYVRTDTIDVPENSILILKEDNFARNAKYISIGRYTQQLVNTSLVNATLEEKRTTISKLEGADERLDRVIVARRKSFSRLGGFTEVQTSLQKERVDCNIDVDCRKCMDEREVFVEVNLKRYRVPCPECNWGKNNQWAAFYDHAVSTEDKGLSQLFGNFVDRFSNRRSKRRRASSRQDR
jgi:hypothetical protein